MTFLKTFFLVLCVLFELSLSFEKNYLYDNIQDLENFDNINRNNFREINKIYNQLIEEDICNIPVESFETLTDEEFLRKYAYSYPVVIRHSKNSNRNKVFAEKCQLDNLVKNFGKKPVTVSSANTHSYRRYSMKFADYVKEYIDKNDDQSNAKLKYGNETWYFFGENNYTEWKEIFESYEKPKFTLPNHEHAYSFGVAGAFSGVPFHFHGPGFAETSVGRKRWFLYAPEDKPDFNPDKSTIQWFIEDYNNLSPTKKPLECVLHPLDVIYFPDRWWHATLNIDSLVVFISTFLSPR